MCDSIISTLQSRFNYSKRFCNFFGICFTTSVSPMELGSADITEVDTNEYLGVTVHAGEKINVDLDTVTRKFYAACNSILCNRVYQSE